jgi:hypothetical protein
MGSDLNSPELNSPELNALKLGSPELSSPGLGSPELGSPGLGSPELVSSASAAPRAWVTRRLLTVPGQAMALSRERGLDAPEPESPEPNPSELGSPELEYRGRRDARLT